MSMFDKIREDLKTTEKALEAPVADAVAEVLPTVIPPETPPVRRKRLPPRTDIEPGMCRARTTGNYGEQRPCRNHAIKGGTVCRFHGGSAPQVKAAAQKRLNELLMPAIERLAELAEQDEHKPSALGAVSTILNHTKGKPGENKGNKGKKGPVIIVGIGLGGLPASAVTVQVQEPEQDEDYEDGELVDGDE